MAGGPLYSPDEIARIRHLRAEGWSWKQIAEVTGRSPSAMASILCRLDKGKGATGKALENKARMARMIELAEQGMRPCDIAREVGMGYMNTYMRLRYAGFDPEVYAEYRAAS